MKKKKLVGFFAGILALAVVAGPMAYYTATTGIVNEMSTKKNGFETSEKFTPKDDWQPGSTVTKEVGVTNTGEYPLLVRISMEESWTRKGAKDPFITIGSKNDKFAPDTADTDLQVNKGDGQTTGDGSVVYKNLNLTNWTYGNDGYWYYNETLSANDSTENLLNSITLYKYTDLGQYTETKYYTSADTKPALTAIGSDPTKQWVGYTGAVPDGAKFSRTVSTLDETKAGYANADYKLTITTQVYQATTEGRQAAVAAGWSDSATPSI